MPHNIECFFTMIILLSIKSLSFEKFIFFLLLMNYFLIEFSTKHNPMKKRPEHGKKKIFLTKEQKALLHEYVNQGKSYKWISSKMGLSYRQVLTHANIKNKGYIKEFTIEEDMILRKLYLSGIIKESQIAKILTKKAPYMIRNRIRALKNNFVLPPTSYNIENNKCETCISNEDHLAKFKDNIDPFEQLFDSTENNFADAFSEFDNTP